MSQNDEFREAFALFDKDGDGKIDSKELGTVMRTLGLKPTQDELQGLIEEFDLDGDQMIDYDEFVKVMTQQSSEMDTEEEIIKAFSIFDKDNTGFISAAELRHILSNLDEKIDEQEINQIINLADTDGDGQINYSEFVTILFFKK